MFDNAYLWEYNLDVPRKTAEFFTGNAVKGQYHCPIPQQLTLLYATQTCEYHSKVSRASRNRLSKGEGAGEASASQDIRLRHK